MDFGVLFHHLSHLDFYSIIYIYMESISLDAIDLRLLDALQRDASQTNQRLAADVGISPPTCLRRVQRLKDEGLIERQVALLSPDRLAAVLGHGLQAVVEISLDRQDAAALDAFETRVIADNAVQQCWRVSPGPDFVLVVAARDMPDYGALTQRLFTADANVRNVKAFFSLKRAKFEPAVPLG
ncbi:Lrp/AsnC family leucine-responsive transcriptional regulator [Variovorax sp. W2I14]